MDDTIKLEVGNIAPNFSLNNQKGESVDLYSVLSSGNKVLLIFYPGDDTPGCTAQLCGVQDVYKVYRDLGVKVLGINQGDQKSHQKFIDKFSYQFDILVDPGRQTAAAWGQIKKIFGHISTKRGVYLVNTDKTILFIKQGQQDNQVILNILKN